MSTIQLSNSIFKSPKSGSASSSSTGSTPPSISSPTSQKLTWFCDKFRPKFDNWIIEPISRLASGRDALLSFILTTCVIDYLAGFWWGTSTIGDGGKAYKGFIDKYFPRNRYDSAGLYDSLRNGLVHMFTIKNKKYALTHCKTNLHLKLNRQGQTILNAGDFCVDLIYAKDQYFSDVEARPELLDKFFERYNRDGFLGLSPL